MNRQRLILLVLAVVFVIASVWSYTALPRQKTIERLTYVPGQRSNTSSPAGVRTSARAMYDSRVLNMALLDKERAEYNGYRHNIFKPLFADEQKFLKQKAAAFKPPVLPPVQPPIVVPATPVAARPETAALAHFTFLGFLKKGNHKTIFLAKDKDILLVKSGDTIAGRYVASAITDQALTLQVVDTNDQIVIPLVENRPLGMAR